jgi:hypothetical protein
MNLKKIGKVFTSKFVGTGPSFYKKKEFTGPRAHKGTETLVYTVCTKINHTIVPVTSFNKYLEYGTSGTE